MSRIKSMLLTGVPASGALGGGGGFTWYVDSVNGNDANTGTSPAQAFETIAALESAGISAGDSIGLARGSQWREQLDIAANNVSVVAYGAGDKPLLDASSIITNASFSKTGGYTNIYEVTITLDADVINWVSVWEDGIRLTRAANLAACDGAAGSIYVADDTAASTTLYIHTSDSSAITSNGAIYEYSARKRGLTVSGVGCTIDGIRTRRNCHNDGSATFGLNSTVRNCQFSEGTKHNVLISSGIMTNCLADYQYYTSGTASMYVYYQNTIDATFNTVSFDNCTAYSASVNTQNGFYGHTAGATSFDIVTVSNCTAENCYLGWSFAHADNVVFSGNTAIECSIGVDIYQDITIQDYTHVATTASNRGIRVLTASPVVIDNMSMSIDAFKFAIYSVQDNADITVTNSTFNGQSYAFYLTKSSISLLSTGNTFESSIGYYFTVSGLSLISDYNNFNPFNNYIPAHYTDLAAWQSATSQDANSTVG